MNTDKSALMRMSRLTLLLVAFLAHSAEPVPRRPAPSDPTLARLERVCCFAFGGVGFVLAFSRGEIDYRAVLGRRSAAADFETVFELGNAPAKCYALTGLRQVNPSRFESLAAPLRSSTTCVAVTRGCLTVSLPLAWILGQIRAGIYSGPMTRGLIPPAETAKPAEPQPEQTTLRRLLGLFFFAAGKPEAPLPPPGPPPPPHLRERAACSPL